jgi:diguanylate cyclase (GGDEF)-like protein
VLVQIVDAAFWELHRSAPLRPLLGFAVLGAAAVAVNPQGSDWRFVGLAGLVLVLSAVALAFGRIRSDWEWLPIAPALAALLTVALLRESDGGAASGYTPLAILAVVWVAVVSDRRAVRFVTLGCALMFAIPLAFVGEPTYPASGWRGAAVFTLIAYLVGSLINSTLAEQRRHAAQAKRHSQEMEEMHKAFAAISTVARSVSLGTDARELVCAAVISSTGARLATVVEPSERGFEISGSAGIPFDSVKPSSEQPGASLTAYEEGRRVFVPDVAREPGFPAVIVRATGIVSAHYEPILREGRPVGVLCAAWDTPRSHLDAKTLAVLQYLAAEAGTAIERCDLLARLNGQARTDQLTTLPNRRAWDEILELATVRSGPMCIAMVDLDRFKDYNDERGHAAGDQLLHACALAWKSQIRPSDTLARYGGEEFAVFLPNCTLSDAAGVMERLRRATPHGATASVGVAERRIGESTADVLERADAALYAAKDAGRDRLQAA